MINPARVYDLFGEILAALSLFSLGLCAFLYFKVVSSSSQFKNSGVIAV